MFTEEQLQKALDISRSLHNRSTPLVQAYPRALHIADEMDVAAKEINALVEAQRHSLEMIKWLRRRGVGELSACTIFDHFVLGRSGCPFAPTDRSDVARCVRLLEQPFAKGWKERMPEMATYKPWSSTALLWYEIEVHYRQTKAEGVADFAFDAKLSNLLNRC